MSGFDLSSIDPVADCEAGTWVHFVDIRTGEPIYADGDESKPCRVHILGFLSDAAQQASKEIEDRREKREAERDVYEGDEMVTKGESTKEEIEADNAEMLARVTTKWENLSYDGKSKFSTETLQKMYLNVSFARNQVHAKFADIRNFMRGRVGN